MKRKERGLSALLTESFLLFAVTLAAVAVGVYWLWNASVDRIYDVTDWDGLVSDPALTGGSFDTLRSYLGGEDAFAVLTPEGKALWASDDSLGGMTAGELACVSEYDSGSHVEAYPVHGADGKTQYHVTRYLADGSSEEMVLDSSYRVVSGGLGDGKTQYTQREYALLAGILPAKADLSLTAFESGGRSLILLMKTAYPDEQETYRAYQASLRIWLLLPPLCVLAAVFFVVRISRAIRRPLDRLGEAISARAEGRSVTVGDCSGVREIRRIGHSFDVLSSRLEESEKERDRLDRARQQMIADVSHDLKTPVTVIAGYADALASGKIPPEEQARCLEVIRSRSRSLAQLADAFHEYGKVEHPAFVLHPEQRDLCEYLREYLAGKYGEIELAGFGLDVRIPEEPIFCRLDAFQLGRALDNLITNSLRHNRLGTLLLVSVRRDGDSVLIRIADNGAGIPREKARTIFDPFVVGSDARGGGGSGLGLSITRRIVELHGGTIALSAHPVLGHGAEFLITLPAAR